MTKQGLKAKSSELKLRTFFTPPMSLPEQLQRSQPSTHKIIIGSFSHPRLEMRQTEQFFFFFFGKRPSHPQQENYVDVYFRGILQQALSFVVAATLATTQLPTFHEERRVPEENRMWSKGNREPQKEGQ